MGQNRKIYTGSGDRGMTSLASGGRVDKDDIIIEANGTLDELNSCLGCLLSLEIPSEENLLLCRIQNVLFEMGAVIAYAGEKYDGKMFADEAVCLEKAIDSMQAEIPMPHGFVLPGGSYRASMGHLSRTVCRRAERRLCSLVKHGFLFQELLVYLNRLSDFLFLLSLKLNFLDGMKENLWHKRCGFEK